MKKRSSSLPAVLAGMAIGGGMVALRSMLVKQEPENTLPQKLIDKVLDRILYEAREAGAIRLGPESRYVIFSDHHKGGRDGADDFQGCERTYMGALKHYLENGYTLIVLGDAEELWEEKVEKVMACYPKVFELEARFYAQGLYMRGYGNHDDLWMQAEAIQQHLSPYFPGIRFHDGILFEFTDPEGENCELFLAHGHQGTIDSDKLRFLGQRFLPLYHDFQNKTGLGRTTPARQYCLRAEHDSQMYRWASKQGKLIFIAGHTHRPVWSSRTHLEKLLWEFYKLQQVSKEARPPDHAEQLKSLKAEVKERERKYPPCNDTIKTRPCYFNTGCCRFKDGDITGIEIDGLAMRLIKWGEKGGQVKQKVLEAAPLAELFAFL